MEAAVTLCPFDRAIPPQEFERVSAQRFVSLFRQAGEQGFSAADFPETVELACPPGVSARTVSRRFLPVHWALHSGLGFEATKAAAELGFDLSAMDASANLGTAFEIAISRGLMPQLEGQTLLAFGADLRAKTAIPGGLMHVAAIFGGALSGEWIRFLLSHGLDLEAPGQEGRSPLAMAADFQASVAMDALLLAGADIERPDANGVRPLHVALRSGSLGSALTLLASGADWLARDLSGRTALHVAARSHPSCGEPFLESLLPFATATLGDRKIGDLRDIDGCRPSDLLPVGQFRPIAGPLRAFEERLELTTTTGEAREKSTAGQGAERHATTPRL
jgi:hypothetical protein